MSPNLPEEMNIFRCFRAWTDVISASSGRLWNKMNAPSVLRTE